MTLGHSQTESDSQILCEEGPRGIDFEKLKPRDLTGFFYLVFAIGLTVFSVWLSSLPSVWIWLAGQFLLALALIQWFAVLHEAGHKTLFRTRRLNIWGAHLAGLMAFIPADCWRIVHAKHHYWTGWQDLDMTTESLVPRRLQLIERIVINTCWWLWIPLFATLYRVNNYWNVVRLWRLFPRPTERRVIVFDVTMYLAVYAMLVWLIGWWPVLKCVGLGVWISFALEDLLILSQHTHIPMTLATGARVERYPPAEQDVFTRSLLFPTWFARLILLNMDAHSLHHVYPQLPGYHLHVLNDQPQNAIRWWKWIIAAKSVRAEVLLFQNRDQTGYRF